MMTTRVAKLAFCVAACSMVFASHAAEVTTVFPDISIFFGSSLKINDQGLVAGTDNGGAWLWDSTKSHAGSTSASTDGSLTRWSYGPGSFSHVQDINNQGVVVGSLENTRTGEAQAMLWTTTTATVLAQPTDSSPRAYLTAINNVGQAAGATQNIGLEYNSRAVMWNGAERIDLATRPMQHYSSAFAMNDLGVVAGIIVHEDWQRHTVLWDATGSIQAELSGPGYSFYTGLDINNAGQVVGGADFTGERSFSHAAMWQNGSVTDLGTLAGFDSSLADGINEAGQIVGSSFDMAASPHATLWQGTTIIDLNTLLAPAYVSAGWELSHATGINARGDIVGDAYNIHTGQYQVFMMSGVTAVPEPSSVSLVAIGLICVGGLRRRYHGRTA